MGSLWHKSIQLDPISSTLKHYCTCSRCTAHCSALQLHPGCSHFMQIRAFRVALQKKFLLEELTDPFYPANFDKLWLCAVSSNFLQTYTANLLFHTMSAFPEYGEKSYQYRTGETLQKADHIRDLFSRVHFRIKEEPGFALKIASVIWFLRVFILYSTPNKATNLAQHIRLMSGFTS